MNGSRESFTKRKLRLCYYNAEARLVDSERLSLEERLKSLWDVRIDGIKTLEDAGSEPFDLMIVAAQVISDGDFPKWLEGMRSRIGKHGAIWTPCLIIKDISFETLRDIFNKALTDNWYFDIMAPNHMDSIPIRIANMLRIHDHIHELKRYSTTLIELGEKVSSLESELAKLKGDG